MNTLCKAASLSVVTIAISGCFYETRTEVVRQPVVPEQPVIERHVVVPPAPQAQQPVIERERVVVLEPPAPQRETIPPPPAPTGYSWVSGRYEWRDGRWVWQQGYWTAGNIRPLPTAIQEPVPGEPPYAGARWVPGYWSLSGNDWIWVRGRWL
jgi:hypothetical protein